MEVEDSVRFKYELKSFVVDKNQHNYLNHVYQQNNEARLKKTKSDGTLTKHKYTLNTNDKSISLDNSKILNNSHSLTAMDNYYQSTTVPKEARDYHHLNIKLTGDYANRSYRLKEKELYYRPAKRNVRNASPTNIEQYLDKYSHLSTMNNSGYKIDYKADKNSMTYRTAKDSYQAKDALDDIIDNYNQNQQKVRDHSYMTNIVDVYKRTGQIPSDKELNTRFETLASVKDVPEMKKSNYIKETKNRLKKFEELNTDMKMKEEEEKLRDKMDKRYNMLKKVQYIYDSSHPGSKKQLLNLKN
eukprot:Mrub_06716.p2 GENE.Mrub_06716~~Mrub_06716.p2  ORF type:complete len:325 (+),score=52.35 Mrub_06716:78-977(+)